MMTASHPPVQIDGDRDRDLDHILAELLQHQEKIPSWDERKAIFIAGIAVAEKLDAFVRHLDPSGEPPRFEALMYRQLRQMERQYRSQSEQAKK